jgi:hypothetical protein
VKESKSPFVAQTPRAVSLHDLRKSEQTGLEIAFETLYSDGISVHAPAKDGDMPQVFDAAGRTGCKVIKRCVGTKCSSIS